MTMQASLGSGYDSRTEAMDIAQDFDLSGRTAIVTGGYAGLGLETVRVLAARGAEVIAAVRNPAGADAALAAMPRVEIAPLDLMSPASIESFAARFVARGRSLDLLINNAGIMAMPLMRDADGHEGHFSVNHLGHFRLTMRLWPALRAPGSSRVITLSSRGHRISAFDFDDPDFLHTDYDKWQAYGRSKTANSLFAVALDERGRAHGIRAFAVHPGMVLTRRAAELPDADTARFGISRKADGSLDLEAHLRRGGDAKTEQQGAATTIWCALSPELDGHGGVFCEDCDIAPAVPADHQGGEGVRPWAVDPQAAERLWTLSETLTGLAVPA